MDNLTPSQKISLDKVISLFLPDEIIKRTAFIYYTAFKNQKHNSFDPNQSEMYWKSSFLIAEKSQYLSNLKGEKIKPISLYANQIIKTTPNMANMLQLLKEMVTKLSFSDIDTKQEINNFIFMLEFGNNFVLKFQNAFKTLNFREIVNQQFGYKQTFLSFAWLMFVDSQNCLDCNNYEKGNCLLTCVFYTMIRYSLEYIKPTFLSELSQQSQKKPLITQILQKLIQILDISDYIEVYKKIATSFDLYFQNLLHSDAFKYSEQKLDFLSPKLININYKRLDYSFQKRMDQNSIDFRLFINQRVSTLSPSPINRIPNLRQKGKTFIVNDKLYPYPSHRILNFDANQTASPRQLNLSPNNVNQGVNKCLQQKLPIKLFHSPASKTPLLYATPLTVEMEIHNYIGKKSKNNKHWQERQFYSESINLIQKINSPYVNVIGRSNIKKINMLIYSFYVSICEQFFADEQKTETNSQHLSLLTYSTYIVRMLNQQFKQNLLEIATYLQPDLLDLWYVGSILPKYDRYMPLTIKHQLDKINKQLISQQIWKSQTLIDQMAQLAANMIDCQPLQLLLKSILRYCDKLICQIGRHLKLDYQTCEQAFNCIKYFVSSNGQTLLNRNIDQIIMCCVYVSSKTNHLQTKFNQIRQAYQETNKHTQLKHREIVSQVYVKGFPPIDIIQFYNQIFINSIRPFIPYIKQPSLQLLNPIFGRKIKYVTNENKKINLENFSKTKENNFMNEAYMNPKTARQNAKGLGLFQQSEQIRRNQTTVRARPHVLNINLPI